MNDDKLIYIIVGLAIGIPLGIFLSKMLDLNLSAQTSSTKVLYGYNYSYDQQGHLTSYVPIPLPTVAEQPITATAQKSLTESLLA